MLSQYEYGMNLWVSAPTKIMGKEYTCAHHEQHPEAPIEFCGRSMTIFCLRASNVTYLPFSGLLCKMCHGWIFVEAGILIRTPHACESLSCELFNTLQPPLVLESFLDFQNIQHVIWKFLIDPSYIEVLLELFWRRSSSCLIHMPPHKINIETLVAHSGKT
jgi:hypothetical protein